MERDGFVVSPVVGCCCRQVETRTADVRCEMHISLFAFTLMYKNNTERRLERETVPLKIALLLLVLPAIIKCLQVMFSEKH